MKTLVIPRELHHSMEIVDTETLNDPRRIEKNIRRDGIYVSPELVILEVYDE